MTYFIFHFRLPAERKVLAGDDEPAEKKIMILLDHLSGRVSKLL